MEHTGRSLGVALVSILIVLAASGRANATNYFVDSSGGSDSNPGTSTGAAWRTSAAVNNHAPFGPGDLISFKRGGSYHGQLWPKGSGSSTSPIGIDAYGVGAMPIIAGDGEQASTDSCEVGGAIKLVNQQNWTIRHLEVTNFSASAGQFVGINVANCSGSQLANISITDNVIHRVSGIPSGYYGTNAGIAVVSRVDAQRQSRWTNVEISRNTISAEDADLVGSRMRIGIFIGPNWPTEDANSDTVVGLPKSSNVTISDNVIHDVGGDGILNYVTSDVLVSHNVVYNNGRDMALAPANNGTGSQNNNAAGIWSSIATRTTVEYNEVYGQVGGGDGEAFDVDAGSDSHHIRYNYSHENMGLVLTCEVAAWSGAPRAIDDERVQYNISYNENNMSLQYGCGQGTLPQGTSPSSIDHNVFFLGQSAGGTFVGGLIGPHDRGAQELANNIFYAQNNPGLFAPDTPDHVWPSRGVLKNNIYFGTASNQEPPDASKLRCDPRLVNPAAVGIGRLNVDGLKLLSDSPAITSGVTLDASRQAPHDYWDNPVSSSGPPNRGAYAGTPLPLYSASNLALCATVTASSSYDQVPWHRTNLVDGLTDATFPTNRIGYSSQPQAHPTSGTCSSCTASAGACSTSCCLEYVDVQLASPRWFNQIVLSPRGDAGLVGAGFPEDFKIQVWNGTSFVDRVVRTSFPQPTTSQIFDLGTRDFTDRVRVCGTKLRPVGTDGYLLQLGEVQVFDTNLALGSTVTSDTSLAPYQLEGWGYAHLADGVRSSVTGVSMGYTSEPRASAFTVEHVVLQLPSVKAFSKIILFPRNDAGMVGAGFPVDFKIQVWNGTSWITRVQKTAYPRPGNAGQAFTWGSTDTTDRIRIEATTLSPIGSSYYLQLAEVEVTQ